MPGSLAFARIRAEVLAAARAVPAGRVTTYSAIGDHLAVTARHVAFVLARLSPEEARVIPWHRVVGAGGHIRIPGPEAVRRQGRLLADEGVATTAAGVVKDFDKVGFRWTERIDRPGVSLRGRYADPATRPLFPESIDLGYPPPR
jgi:methylated-DNA-protein-cysteine methyltransferase-like protein